MKAKLSENSTQIEYQSEQGNIKGCPPQREQYQIFHCFYQTATVLFSVANPILHSNYITRLFGSWISMKQGQYKYTLRTGTYLQIEYGGPTRFLTMHLLISYATRTDINTTYSAGQIFVKDCC